MNRIAPATIVLLLLAATAVCAQPGVGADALVGDSYPIPIRSFGGPENLAVKRCLAANLNGDLRLDLVIHRGQRPVMVSGPGLTSAMTRYPTGSGTPDLAVLPATSAGQVDEVLTIGSSLKAWRYDRPNDQFLSRSLGTPSVWDGVEMLCCAQIGGNSAYDVVGAEGKNIHVLLDADHTMESEYSFTCARVVHEVLPFVRDASGTVELALRCDLGVMIYSVSGAFRQLLPGVGDGALATANSGEAYDDLAWIQTGTTDQLLIVDNDGTDLTLGATPLGLGALDVIAVSNADWDGDGDEDLLISYTSDCGLKVLLQDSGFSAGGIAFVDFGPGSAANNLATPVTGDFDNDGDVDAALAIRSHQYLYVVENETVDHDALSPPVLSDGLVLNCNTAVGSHVITFDPWVLPVTGPLPTGHELCIELVRWTKPSATEPTNPTGERFLLDLDIAQPVIEMSTPWSGGDDWDFSEVYFYGAWYAVVDAVGATVAVYPPTIRAFTFDDYAPAGAGFEGPGLAYLRSLPGGFDEESDFTVVIECIEPPSDGTNDGDTKPAGGFGDDDDPGH